MKKIHLCITWILLFSLLCTMLSGCSSGFGPSEEKSWSERIAEYSYWNKVGTLKKDLTKHSNASAEELTAYDNSKFRYAFGGRNVFIQSASSQQSLESYNANFPIESIKSIDDDTVCVVYRLETEDQKTTLAYVVFQREIKYFTKKDGVDKAGKYEHWERKGEIYFVSEKLDESAFSDVSIGDSFFSVAEIDNGVYFDADYDCFGFFVTGYPYSITSYRILTDGIMIIRFAPVDQKPVQKPELSEDIVIEMPDVSEDTVMPELSEYVVIEKTFYSFGSDEFPADISLTSGDILD